MVMAWGGLAARQGNQVRFPPAHPVWSDVLAEDLPPRPASVLPPGTAAWYGTPYPQTVSSASTMRITPPARICL